MTNKKDLIKLKTTCDDTLHKAQSTENQCEVGFFCGWLSAMCLVYAKYDKKYFASLQEKVLKIFDERGML